MTSFARRRVLQQATTAGAAWSANLIFGRFSWAQTPASGANASTRVYLDSRRTLPPLDRNLFGSFLEHLGRAIYGGIYEPGSKLSDSNGFRKDVLDEVKRLGVPIIRYPSGNFVSGYHWQNGVGPKKGRPRVLEKAWDSIETNQFGTNEFMAWCRLAGAAPLMGLNLGTGTPEQAAALVEYCNVEKGTRWSDLRREHGIAEPHRVQHWCLGNEMDGPWQIGHMSATEYGLKAADAARQMRYVDHGVKLVACGSSGPFMPTYLEWDREVLEQCYDYVDGLSLHRYFGNARETNGDTAKYLAMNLSMERQSRKPRPYVTTSKGANAQPKNSGFLLMNGMSRIARRAATRSTARGRNLLIYWKKSTTLRTLCLSVASSIPCFAIPTASRSLASPSWSTSLPQLLPIQTDCCASPFSILIAGLCNSLAAPLSTFSSNRPSMKFLGWITCPTLMLRQPTTRNRKISQYLSLIATSRKRGSWNFCGKEVRLARGRIANPY